MEGATHRWPTSRWTGSMASVGLAILLSVALVGCGATEPWELVDVQISVVDSVFTPETPVEFEITAVNRGRQEVMVSLDLCPPMFDVLDPSERIVGPGTPLCTLELRAPTRLGPGGAVSQSHRWSGELYTAGGGSNVLPFGDYALRGWALVLPDHRVYSGVVGVRFVDVGG